MYIHVHVLHIVYTQTQRDRHSTYAHTQLKTPYTPKTTFAYTVE